jgi:carboxyl-terminal processing protease
VTRILSLGCIIVGLALLTWSANTRPADTPQTIANLAIQEIDEHYLYASSPAWKAVRQKIVNSTASDRDAMYAFLAHELASMRDSELHVVTPSELVAVQREGEGKRLGVGLMEFSIDLVPSTGEARIVTPLIGSPAAISGLRPRDVIVAVDGKSTRELDHEKVLDFLRSASSTELLIRRGKRNFRVHLSPSDAPLEPITTRSLPAGPRRIAYLQISQFTPEVGAKARAAVQDFERDHANGYIVDLRNNPGGFLDAATQVASLFMTGSLGAKVRRDGTAEPISSSGTPLTDGPLVILVNEGTASAAEFVAGALHRRKRTIILGVQTYGRGQTQVYEALSDGYGLIIPSALLRTPDGRDFKGTGLRPDIVGASQAEGEVGPGSTNERQLQRAIATIQQVEP